TPAPAVNVPVPMDIDTACSHAHRLDLCYRCGKTGHMPDRELHGACPHHQDICMLTPGG
ncbi:group specific antigen of marY1, partial [Tricholoma matsutake]